MEQTRRSLWVYDEKITAICFEIVNNLCVKTIEQCFQSTLLTVIYPVCSSKDQYQR